MRRGVKRSRQGRGVRRSRSDKWDSSTSSSSGLQRLMRCSMCDDLQGWGCAVCLVMGCAANICQVAAVTSVAVQSCKGHALVMHTSRDASQRSVSIFNYYYLMCVSC
jgi:hypothetical protein